ncbi:MAG: fasciclin domain-containing protein [Planctomycetes bacterium]|nr:fasciclin domain-containing protein [Planctomycetota bacterium]
MKARLFAGVVLAALVGASVPGPAPAAGAPSIYETLLAREELVTAFVAVVEAEEATALQSPGEYTLFAPSDAAFKKLDEATVKKLVSDKEMVRRLIGAHLAKGALTAAKLKEEYDGKEVPTLRGAWKVQKLKDGLRVGAAKIVGPDITCSNGVIHVIDTVLPMTE